MDERDERYEKIPWDQLMQSGIGPARRTVWMGGAALVVVGVLAFLAGSRAIPPLPAAAAPPPTSTTVPSPADEPAPPLPSEADLRAPDGGTAAAIELHLADAWTAPGVWVDDVGVESLGDGSWLAAVSLLEVVDGDYRRVPPIGLSLRVSTGGGRVTVESIEPVVIPEVVFAAPAGAVDTIPDPVRDALVDALEPWPGAAIGRAGSDAGRWWADVSLPLPGGGSVSTVVWPELPVGLGSGG